MQNSFKKPLLQPRVLVAPGLHHIGAPGRTIINKRGLGLGYYEYKDRTPGGHQIANSQSVLIPAGV